MNVHDPVWPGLMVEGATSWEQLTVLGTILVLTSTVIVFMIGSSWRP